MRPEVNYTRTLRRTVVLVAVAGFFVAFALGGCTAGQGSPRQAATISGASISAAPSSAGSGGGAGALGQTAAAPRPVGGRCPAGTKKATIGTNESCLGVGQLCEKTERAAYPSYGLLCLPRGDQYVLVTK